MILPTPLSLETLRAHTPTIAPVPQCADRPYWSVVIPTYNSCAFLRRTLESVLCQDAGPSRMQIEVVDGGSTKDDPQALVKEVGKGRVSFFQIPVNRGSAHTYNTCLKRARGQWIHMLHGDDMVRPGFYEAYEAQMRALPDARMVLCQHVHVDESDRWMGTAGPTLPCGDHLVRDFGKFLATEITVMCPAVVVHRDVYEAVGGFCSLFDSCNDWDMWFRVALAAPVACVGHPYALYRVHGTSLTKQLMVSARNIEEAYYVVSANLERLNGIASAAPRATWRSRLANAASTEAWLMDNRNCFEGRYHQSRWAWMLDPTPQRLIMLMKSWLKLKLKGKVAMAAM